MVTEPVVPVEGTPEADEQIELSKLAYARGEYMPLPEFIKFIQELKSAQYNPEPLS